MTRNTWFGAGVLALGGLATACASAPAQSGMQANSAIHAAEVVGAEGQPRSAYYLQLARDQVALAEQLSARGEDAEAKRMLLRAQADAELSIALAGESSDRTEAQALERHIGDMRDNTL